jgi:hypothetical protein
VPASGTFCGLPDELSVTLTASWNTPLFPGWNLILIVQFAPGPRLLGQLLVWLNGLVTLMWLIFRTPAPELVSVPPRFAIVIRPP